MRINEPVTDKEIVMLEGQTIVSETNLKGVLTHVNRDFLDISGFSQDELMKKNHNIIRHPDMPPEAFQNLWDTVKASEPWVGMVKNRCKNGDFYWVEANVTPTFEDGKATGYLSVRRKPSRKQITEAEELYAAIRNGTTSLVVKSRVPGLDTWRHSRLITRMAAQVLGLMVMIAAMGVADFSTIEADSARALFFTGLGGSTLFSAGLLRWFHVAVLKPQQEISDHLRDLAESKFDGRIDLGRSDEIGDLMRRLKCMQVKIGYDVDAGKVREQEMSRITSALDCVNTNVLVADEQNIIIYANDRIKEMFRDIESEVRKDLPNFDAGRLVGSNIDIFHKNPAHQRGMLASLNSTHRAEIRLGEHTLRFVANPVVNADGNRLGTVVEWIDRTQELAIESDVQQVVDDALAGDLTKRISLDDKEGFFERLSSGVNHLVGAAETVINDTIRVLSAIAVGNLTETIEADYQGSFGQLKGDANATVAKLTEVVGNIQSAAASVKTGAGEISQGNTDLSQRTEEQASNLEETASSMEEMTCTVKQNADNAREANALAIATRDRAEEGGSVVSQAVLAMNEINTSSEKISDIIGVIDEIAFQTNLLALNASVEAARAGDQGRGFAVVASEVRNLAGRSATAAKEIKELIEDSAGKVEEGSRLVNESGETLEEIVNGVKKVTDIVGEIAAASQEQSAGIEEVNKAVEQMDELTQQNAALVEEAAAASESLGEQADDLNQMMEFFTVDDRGAMSSAQSDRRSTERPWSASEIAAANAAATPRRKAVANGGDQEWEEF